MDEIIDNEQDESFEIIDVKENELRETEFRVSDLLIIEFKTNFPGCLQINCSWIRKLNHMFNLKFS